MRAGKIMPAYFMPFIEGGEPSVTKRTLFNVAVIVGIVATYLAWTTSEASAEPLSGPSTQKTAPPPLMKELKEGYESFGNRDYEAALKSFKEASKKDVDLPPGNIILATSFFRLNDTARARAALEKAVSEAPNDPEAYVIMGNMAINEGRIFEAAFLYHKAQELIVKFDRSPKRKELLAPAILSGLAAVLQAREDWAGAQKYLEAWLKLDPKSIEAMERLAGCLFRQKNAIGALEKLKAMQKIDSKILTPEAILAQYYANSDDQDNAKKWYDIALQVAPKDPNTIYQAGEWAFNSSNIAEAKKLAFAARQLDPTAVKVLVLCGVVELFEKNYNVAEKYFEMASNQDPGNFVPKNNLALALIEQKDDKKRERAYQYALMNVNQNQKRAEAYATFGWICYKLNKLDDAEKAFNIAASAGQVSPDTAFHIACLSRDRGNDAAARIWLKKAIESKAPFSMRKEAREMLESLSKK
jgi:protein O-GlcNAc transferase